MGNPVPLLGSFKEQSSPPIPGNRWGSELWTCRSCAEPLQGPRLLFHCTTPGYAAVAPRLQKEITFEEEMHTKGSVARR